MRRKTQWVPRFSFVVSDLKLLILFRYWYACLICLPYFTPYLHLSKWCKLTLTFACKAFETEKFKGNKHWSSPPHMKHRHASKSMNAVNIIVTHEKYIHCHKMIKCAHWFIFNIFQMSSLRDNLWPIAITTAYVFMSLEQHTFCNDYKMCGIHFLITQLSFCSVFLLSVFLHGHTLE